MKSQTEGSCIIIQTLVPGSRDSGSGNKIKMVIIINYNYVTIFKSITTFKIKLFQIGFFCSQKLFKPKCQKMSSVLTNALTHSFVLNSLTISSIITIVQNE